jgi:hypothetical protein
MWWILERTHHPKFPYLLRIEGGKKTVLCLHVQEKWPGPRGQVFCLRGEREETFRVPDEDVVERVPVVSLKRYGKRLAVVLERSKNKAKMAKATFYRKRPWAEIGKLFQ